MGLRSIGRKVNEMPLPYRVRHGWGNPGGAVPTLVISANNIAEDAALTDVIGTLSVLNLGILTVSSYAITADPDSKFDIDSDDLIVDGALDYETATSHSVTIRATLSDASTVDRTFTITVTNVAEGGDAPSMDFSIATNSMYVALLGDF